MDANFANLKMRSVGPALMSGRIADIAIDPMDESIWYIAVGSGGVWKTSNAGITWKPIFDNQTSYSIGCVTIDPNNHNTIWLGTGENVGGRHVGYGDGVYVSHDGGAHWKHMGLKESEHISKIMVHPSDPNIVWVAAQGPLWSEGGERGLYKTVDQGKTWNQVLGDEKWTGVTDLVMDPRNPDVLYAATWQRHRTTAAYMGGGPGSGLHKSTDGGETWDTLKTGLPKSNMGKIGLAISPQKPDILYAAIELDQRKGVLFKSLDQGSSWAKQSDAVSGATGPHYYQELYACPHHFDRIYLMDVRTQISDNGGKSFRRMKEKFKHSDNHAMAFLSDDDDFLLFGTDGGLYETRDLAENWRFFDNLPLTQFYKLAVDDTEPFYNIYGGTQDNSTQGGPSRTDKVQGIQNSDWSVVLDWDGHQPATEPGNPDIMYGQRQEGYLSRIDLSTGQVMDIQPQAAPGDPHERYNWDAPIFVSPHKATRIYHASYRLWRSEDRGDSWKAISEDLTRGEERMDMPIMGRKQSVDNPWDFLAMSNFGTITSISESPVQEDLIYIGTDDGLIQVTENGGEAWKKTDVSSMPGVPVTAYVNNIMADLFDANTVYAALDNHKHGDFKPYLLKSTNRGKSWVSIAGNIPERHLVWRLVQDTENPEVLFTGTEFGIYFTHNGGKEWTKIKGGMPNIPVRDITIQRRENDLVAATFGRSFYVFDDISVFREVTDENLNAEGKLYSTRDAWWYIPRSHLGFSEKKGNQGSEHYTADNPPFGAVFTYHLDEGYKSKKEERKEKEKKQDEAGEDILFPGWDEIEAEENEVGTRVWLVVKDEAGNVMRKLEAKNEKGFHRIAWDLRLEPNSMVRLDTTKSGKGSGLLVAPGNYQVELLKEDSGSFALLSGPEMFEVKEMQSGAIENPLASNREQYWNDYRDITRQASQLNSLARNLKKQAGALQQAYRLTPKATEDMAAAIANYDAESKSIYNDMYGNPIRSQIGEKNPPLLGDRIFSLSISIWGSTYGPTPRSLELISVIDSEMTNFSSRISQSNQEFERIAQALYDVGGPWIEGMSPKE